MVVFKLNPRRYSAGSNLSWSGNKNIGCRLNSGANGKMGKALLSWFNWPWDPQQDFPFISSSQEASSHHNLYPGWVLPSQTQSRLRQPLNEDRSALLSQCIVTKLSPVFVCESTQRPPIPPPPSLPLQCFNIAIFSKQVSSVSTLRLPAGNLSKLCCESALLFFLPRPSSILHSRRTSSSQPPINLTLRSHPSISPWIHMPADLWHKTCFSRHLNTVYHVRPLGVSQSKNY